MFAKLKAAWDRLASGGAGDTDVATAPAVEYNGYRIRPAPYRADGVYQTAGIIEKDTPEGVKEHRFVRADTHPSKEDAIAFAILILVLLIRPQGILGRVAKEKV